MSNRLFFTVPLVLMGVLSGCNTTSLKEASTSFSSIITGKPTPEESIAYAKKTLYCSDTEFLPTNKSIQETEKRSQAELISEGKRVSVAYPTYFTNKNCELAAKSYSYCKGAEQESDCIKGFMFKAIITDKPELNNIEAVLADKENQEKLNEIKRQKAQLEYIQKEKDLKKSREEHKAKLEQEVREQQEVNFRRVLSELKGDSAYEKTYDILMNKWDERSRDEFRKNPSLVAMLHRDVKSGMFYKVEPLAEAARNTDGGTKSNLDYYKLGSQAYYQGIEDKKRAYLEQLASNETKLNADLYWYTGQINERKLKLSRLQSGTKEYAETVKELDHLNNELIPLNLAKDLIKQREQDATNRRIAQERDYQQRQLDQQRQAQQAQLEYQRKQLELQRQQAEAIEEANNPFSLQNRLKSLEDMNRRNKPVNCSTVGGVTTCF